MSGMVRGESGVIGIPIRKQTLNILDKNSVTCYYRR
jgi:hypothetical protein